MDLKEITNGSVIGIAVV